MFVRTNTMPQEQKVILKTIVFLLLGKHGKRCPFMVLKTPSLKDDVFYIFGVSL